MTYKEARVYLDEMSKYGSVLGLEAIRGLLRELGNPQDDLKFIHIAGTNGKGSVLAYTSTILSEAGYRIGRYVSPTVVSSCYKGNNMICINAIGNIYDGKQARQENMWSGGNKAPKIIEPNFGNSRLNKMLKVQEIPTDETVCIDSYNQSVIKGVFCTIKSNIGTENMKYVTEPLSCAMQQYFS